MSHITPSQILKSLSDETAELVGKVAPSVVGISNQQGRGTGIVWSSDGYIVTCNHVVGRRRTVRVGLGERKFSEGKVIGRDPNSDVALLKIKEGELKPIEIGNSENLRVGQFVIALANPYSRDLSAASGIITSVRSSFRRWRGMTMGNALVTDATLNPGYSGGPLVDVSGKMIGLNSAYIQSRGIAVPINTVKTIADMLISEGKITRAYLGITSNTIQLPQEIATQAQISQDEGIIVLSVEKNSPAKRAGLVLGDIIVKLDEKPVTNTYDLNRLLSKEMIGKETKLRILRAEKPMELKITPTERRNR